MCRVNRRTGLAATLALLLIVVALVGEAGAATPKARPLLPARVYAPYFQTWRPAGIKLIAQQSGVRYFTLAFVEATSRTSCVPAWNGRPVPDGRGRPVPVGDRGAAVDGRRRGAVVWRIQRRSQRQRGRRLVPLAPRPGRGLQVGDHHPQRDPARHGRRGSLTGPHGRDRPSQQGAAAGRELGPQHGSKAADPIHPADHAPRARGRCAGCAQERQGQRHPRGRREHHDLRLLRRQDHQDGAGRDHRRQEACTPSCTRSTPTAPAGPCGRWRATRCCRGSTTTRPRPRSPISRT